MSSNYKSIIFVKPYDKVTQVLLGAFYRGNAPINVFEASDIIHAGALLEQNYPAVTVLTDARHTLTYLTENLKHIRLTSSKTLLITPSLLPIKLTQKLQKFGLTENIEGSIQPKSLLYKVQLLIRSLPEKNTIKVETGTPKAPAKKANNINNKENEVINAPYIDEQESHLKHSTKKKDPLADINHDDPYANIPQERLVGGADDNELLDNDTRDLLHEFCKESDFLLDQMRDAMDQFEREQDPKLLEEYGQVIDRMMGSAKTIGLDDFSKYCELGKMIGYKANQCKNPILLDIVVAILIDATLLLKDLVQEIKTGTKKVLKNNPKHKTFISRLRWLSKKFTHIERSSVAIDGASGGGAVDQQSIDDLLNGLGF